MLNRSSGEAIIKVGILLIFGLVSVSFESFAAEFWDKPELQKRLREREILVSVTSSGAPAIAYTIKGVGFLRRGCEESLKKAIEFEKLKEVSSVFKQVQFNQAKQNLVLEIEILNRSLHLELDLKVEPLAREIGFSSKSEIVQGLNGKFRFKVLPQEGCELSVFAELSSPKSSLGRAFFGFALEVALQKIAQKMRDQIEAESQVKKTN